MELHYYRPMKMTVRFGGAKDRDILADTFKMGQSRGNMANAVAKVLLGDAAIQRDSVGYDFVSTGTGKKIEVRTVRCNGTAAFARSSNYGAGRQINFKEFASEAEDKDYALAKAVPVKNGVEYTMMLIPGIRVREEGPNWSKATVEVLFDGLKDDHVEPVYGW